MTDDLSPTRALALWGLLARQGRAPAAEVKPKADRDALVADGYAEADKASKTVALTDRGWNWAGEHLAASLPPAQRPLQDLLARLGAHLHATGGTLAAFIGEAPPLPAPPAKPSRAKPPSKARAAPKREAAAAGTPRRRTATPDGEARRAKAPTPAALRKRIEQAYLGITGGTRSQGVRLTRLRAELGELDRSTVDKGLAAILKGDKTARLGQIDDLKGIDAADREAAFSPAGEHFHLIWIQ